MITKNILIKSIDAEVRKIIDTFRIALKYTVLFRGTGIEFAGYREYIAGEDDASKIDWVASMRSNKTVIKQFEEERNLDVYILLDTSATMLFGSREQTKSEFAAVIAGVLASAGMESGDNFGFGFFNDTLRVSMQPANDAFQYYRILDYLIDPSTYGGACNLGEALKTITNTLDHKTFLFIISDFIGLDSEWVKYLKMCSGKFEKILGIMIRDIRDEQLPREAGYMRLYNPLDRSIAVVDTRRIRKRFEQVVKRDTEKIFNEFLHTKAGIFRVYTHESFADRLTEYIERSVII